MIMKNVWIFIKLFCAAASSVPDYEEITDSTNAHEALNLNTNNARHVFFRRLGGEAALGTGSRRVFGGAAAELEDFPAVCALLDRYWAVRCTATILTEHWVLTAGHCVTPKIAYVKYNTRTPASSDGNVTAVLILYQHPQYEVEQKDEGRGLDVTKLQHDVGLVRTRDTMELKSSPIPVLNNLRASNPFALYNADVQVLGFGRTERSVLGEELFAVQLRLVGCDRGEWVHCVCGVAREPRGVCSGDSGGPVLYEGSPVGVTSMGPVECADSGTAPPQGATSVFTALQQYADIINATILDTETALRMRIVSLAATTVPESHSHTILLITLFLNC